MSQTAPPPAAAAASEQGAGQGAADDEVTPPHRYTAALAAQIEKAWQDRWEREGTFEAPNPSGPLGDPDAVAARPKRYVLDMFPYPSGIGLHVGHPLGYIATDVHGRFKRMTGHNVLHALGYDAFGLPAEQYAVQTGQHPRVTTEANIATMRQQLRRLGLAHDARRSVSTTDPDFYRWTQWIFLQVYNAWYDDEAGHARPISELEAELAAGRRSVPDGVDGAVPGVGWDALDDLARRRVVDAHRLAYLSYSPVNWCPGLGTVLANEEVTSDGRSEVGNFPVFKRDLRQWMMRITSYADRLLGDLERLDWPESIKLSQRNWIGRSEGARVAFPSAAGAIEVFTTRPDTLFGATFMVLAPEHPLVDHLVPAQWPEGTSPAATGGAATPAEAVEEYRGSTAQRSDLERQAEGREKTGVFTGGYATNPVTGAALPVYVADYVLMGYGTGAIMAVPGQDARDWEFATRFSLPVVRTVQPPADFAGEAYTGEGPAINSANDSISLDGLPVVEAKARIIDWLEERGAGRRTVTYKLRDWLFSRQRYWGEPFPIVYDEDGMPRALPDSMLPVELPEVVDYSPQTFAEDDRTTEPVPPLGRRDEWVAVTLDLGDGPKPYRRETNTMPQWAGSCWYELRYLDPTNTERFVDPDVERYWMGPQGADHTGGVDLYVGGQEHAVLHLLYARFWHKVLHDLGHLSSSEPFHRLYNQGYIEAPAFTDERGSHVPAAEVVEGLVDGRPAFSWQGNPVQRSYGKMGKSLKNMVTPDEMFDTFGADTFRLYEMSMGPLDQSKPWETRAVVGSQRFLQRLWRNIVDEQTGRVRVVEEVADDETRRLLHRTIDRVRHDLESLSNNTAIARLTELNNHVVKLGTTHREVAEAMVLMVAPLAPHLAEELWSRLGHGVTLTYEPFPTADPALLVVESVTCVLQVAGKVRDRVEVSPEVSDAELQELALASEAVQRALEGREVRTVVVRAPRLVNVVPA